MQAGKTDSDICTPWIRTLIAYRTGLYFKIRQMDACSSRAPVVPLAGNSPELCRVTRHVFSIAVLLTELTAERLYSISGIGRLNGAQTNPRLS